MPSRMPYQVAAVLTLLPTLCGTARADGLARLEAAYARTGESERCLSRHRIDRVRVIDESHVLFRTGPSRHYLNELARPCAALDRHDALLIDTRTSRLCDIDTVQVIEPGTLRALAHAGPACFLGRFERLERKMEAD